MRWLRHGYEHYTDLPSFNELMNLNKISESEFPKKLSKCYNLKILRNLIMSKITLIRIQLPLFHNMTITKWPHNEMVVIEISEYLSL